MPTSTCVLMLRPCGSTVPRDSSAALRFFLGNVSGARRTAPRVERRLKQRSESWNGAINMNTSASGQKARRSTLWNGAFTLCKGAPERRAESWNVEGGAALANARER
jgi:hypothetical protein